MASSLFDLSGRVALVTGASRGIGRAIAQGLAGAGASIALSSRTQVDLLKTAEEIRALGVRAETFPVDVACVTEIQALMRDVLVRMGQVDILVNAAGVNRRAPSMEISEEDWDTVLDLNLKGLFFTAQAVGRYWIETVASRSSIIEERARSLTSAASPERWALAAARLIRRVRVACRE